MKLVKIKPNVKIDETKEIYFADDFFDLINPTEFTPAETTYQKIASALIQNHYQDFPYLLSKILATEKGYKILYMNLFGEIKITYINLEEAKEINPRQAAHPLNQHPIELKNNIEHISHTIISTKNPFMFLTNTPALKKIELEFLKEKNLTQPKIEEGKMLSPFQVSTEPDFTEHYEDKDYSFDKFSAEIPALEDFLKLYNIHKCNKVQLQDFIFTKEKLLISCKSLCTSEAAEDIKQLNEAANLFQEALVKNETQLVVMLYDIKQTFAQEYVKVLNQEAELRYIKKYLAWALLFAAQLYFKDAKSSEASEKIQKFNIIFKAFIQLKDDDNNKPNALDEIYNAICNKSLKEIETEISHFLSTDTRAFPGWDITKRNAVVKKLNELSCIIQEKLSLPATPFTATEKNFILLKNAALHFDKTLYELEENKKKLIERVEHNIAEGQYSIIDNLNINDELFLQQETIKRYPKVISNILTEYAEPLPDILKQCRETIKELAALPINITLSFKIQTLNQITIEDKNYQLNNQATGLQHDLNQFEHQIREINFQLQKNIYNINAIHREVSETNSARETHDSTYFLKKIHAELTGIDHLQFIHQQLNSIITQLNTAKESYAQFQQFFASTVEFEQEILNKYEIKIYEKDIAIINNKTTNYLVTEYYENRRALQHLNDNFTAQINFANSNFIEKLNLQKVKFAELKNSFINHYQLIKKALYQQALEEKLKSFKKSLEKMQQELQHTYLIKNIPPEFKHQEWINEYQDIHQMLLTFYNTHKELEIKHEPGFLNALKSDEVLMEQNFTLLKNYHKKITAKLLKLKALKMATPITETLPAIIENISPPSILEEVPAEERETKSLLKHFNFIKQHWRTILFATLIGIGFTIISLLTSGISSLLLCFLVTFGGATLGGGVGITIGKANPTQPEHPLSFLKQHYKKLIAASLVGLALVGLIIASVCSFGAGGVAMAAIGAATCVSLKVLGLSVGSLFAGVFGIVNISIGVSMATAALTACYLSIKAGFRQKHAQASVKIIDVKVTQAPNKTEHQQRLRQLFSSCLRFKPVDQENAHHQRRVNPFASLKNNFCCFYRRPITKSKIELEEKMPVANKPSSTTQLFPQR